MPASGGFVHLLALGLGVACAPARALAPAGSPSAEPTAAAPAPAAEPHVVERLPPPPRQPATAYASSEPGRPSYAAPPLRADPRELRRLDAFTRSLLAVVAEAATDSRVVPPIPDERRHALARDIARLSRVEQPPPSEAVRFLTAHHGVVETDPLIFTLRGPAIEESALEHFRRALPRVFQRGTWNRVGVGSVRRGEERTSVVLLWQQLLELEPLPRQLPSRGRAPVRGRFLRAMGNPQLVVTMPGGYVRRLPMTQRQDRFEADLRCAFGDGRYQVEMMAADTDGPLVVANFPVFCGVAAPVDVAAHDEEDPAEIDPAIAEQELYALINQDRRAAGLRPLTWDNRLAAIARAHSRDMAENRFIAHVSPTTGDTATRVRRAGAAYPLILENVGQEGGVRQAHQGFMNSPGHRANVLNEKVGRLGIGVVVSRRRGDAPVVVTELFAGE